jgi:DNA-binding beta-propeller fold protein YncE
MSPDGKFIVSGGGNDAVKVWDIVTGGEILSLPAGEFGVGSVAYSPDGKRIAAAGSEDNIIRIWDSATGVEVMNLRGPDFMISSITFSPNGTTIAVGSVSGISLIESNVPANGYEPRQTAQEARKIVGKLYAEHGSYSKVIDELNADKTLDEPVRKVALQIANSRKCEDAEKTE